MCNSIQRQIEAQQRQYVSAPARQYVSAPNLEAVDEFEPCSMAAADALVDLVAPRPGDLVVDFAGGDGRLVTTALLAEPGARGSVIEINPETAELARKRVAAMGMQDRIKVVNDDARKYSYSNADICYLYAFSDLINRLIKDRKLDLSKTAVVSLNHDFEGSELVYHRGFPIHVSLPS